MLKKMSLGQVSDLLSQQIDWNIFFEKIDIEQKNAIDFIDALAKVSDWLNITFDPLNIDLIYTHIVNEELAFVPVAENN